MPILRTLRILVLAALAGGCAEAPRHADGGAGAALHWTLETAGGRFVGSATAYGPGRLLTNRHVVDAAQGAPLVARRGLLAAPVLGVRLAAAADAALLSVGERGVATPRLRTVRPVASEPLYAAGAVAGASQFTTGHGLEPRLADAFRGMLLAARLPVAPGFSGGPVTDGEGRLIGIVAAAVAGSFAEAQRLAAETRPGLIALRTTLIIPVGTIADQVLAPLNRAGVSGGSNR